MSTWSRTLPPEIVAAMREGTLEIGQIDGFRFIESSQDGRYWRVVYDRSAPPDPLPAWAMRVARRCA